MLEGRFQEHADDPHVAARQSSLAMHCVLPPPDLPVILAQPGKPIDVLLAPLQASLESAGLAQVQFETPPSNDTFRTLGERLGAPMPETDPAVLPFVEQSVILNVISRHGQDAEPSLQPFSTDYLSLHSECSGRAMADQPRYIALLCLEPGDDATQAQTVLVPMGEVAARLPDRALQVLMATRYRHLATGPMIARQTSFGPCFSFRDFRASALDWTSDEDDASEVDAALRRLLAAMYADGPMSGIHWHRGLMVVVDNFRFFHGRTGGARLPSQRVRHLVRLRLR